MLAIVQIFTMALCISSLLVFISSIWVGIFYFLAVLPLIAFSNFIKNQNAFVFGPVFGAILAFYAFYFIRPIFLIPNTDMYPYYSFGPPSSTIMIYALMVQSLYAIGFSFSLYFVMKIKGSRINLSLNKLNYSPIADIGPVFLTLLFLTSLAWLMLFVFAGAGQKLVVTEANLLLLILPVSLIIPGAICYLKSNRSKKLSLVQRAFIVIIVGGNVITTLLTGSKSGIFLLILYVVFYLLLTRGNYKVGVIKLSAVTLITIGAVLAGVILANVAKYSTVSEKSLAEIFLSVVGDGDDWMFLINKITFRLNGFDGTIAVILDQPTRFAETANWPSLIYSGIAQLLPGLGTDQFSMGKAVGIEFGGRSVEASHAGALGLIGVIFYMHGPVGGFIVMAILGALFGFLFRIIARIASHGRTERLIAFVAMMHMQSWWISSGNIDKLIQGISISFVHLLFYYVAIKFLASAIITKKRKRSSLYVKISDDAV